MKKIILFMWNQLFEPVVMVLLPFICGSFFFPVNKRLRQVNVRWLAQAFRNKSFTVFAFRKPSAVCWVFINLWNTLFICCIWLSLSRVNGRFLRFKILLLWAEEGIMDKQQWPSFRRTRWCCNSAFTLVNRWCGRCWITSPSFLPPNSSPSQHSGTS